jgi:regulator of PEP synthase PpsR (kinase-PPPase family)
MDAIHFAQARRRCRHARLAGQLILVSRCGKTPTSLYLAMQFASGRRLPALTPTFSDRAPPGLLLTHKDRLFDSRSIRSAHRCESDLEASTALEIAATKCANASGDGREAYPRSTRQKSIEEIATTILYRAARRNVYWAHRKRRHNPAITGSHDCSPLIFTPSMASGAPC